MTRARGPAVAAALGLALAAAGCGLGPGEGRGTASLTATRDYGGEVLVAVSDPISESDTVLRLLDRSAEITTRYGGGFVQSIEGLEASSDGGRLRDWFFYVNGVEAPVGSADFRLRDGERIWWDHHDWSAVMRVPAVVGSWPEPFRHGYESRRRSWRVVCRAAASACTAARRRIADAAGRSGGGGAALRVLVGAWPRLRRDPAARLLADGPATSGVFASFAPRRRGWRLRLFDARARPVRSASPAGLVAALRDGQRPPTWLVTGTDASGVGAAVRLLAATHLRNRFAVATMGGEEIGLPLP